MLVNWAFLEKNLENTLVRYHLKIPWGREKFVGIPGEWARIWGRTVGSQEFSAKIRGKNIGKFQ